MKVLFFAGMLLVLVASCTHNEHKVVKHYTLKGDTICVEPASALYSKLTMTHVERRGAQQLIEASGTVRAIPNNFARVAAPFAGRITRSYVHLGDHLRAGDPLFAISSPAFFEASTAWFQARQELQLATKQRARQRDLMAHGVGIQRELDEAEVNYNIRQRDMQTASSSLEVYRVNPEQMIPGQPLIVRSPIVGELVKNDIVAGQYLHDDADPVACVARLDTVWVAAQVKEKDIRYVVAQLQARVNLTAMPDKIFDGVVEHVSELLDEATRSVEVFVRCANPQHIMKPGMYVQTLFDVAEENVLVIPSTALLQQEDDSIVMLQVAPGRYVRRVVKTLAIDDTHLKVLSGLNAGDEIVTTGAFYLLEAR